MDEMKDPITLDFTATPAPLPVPNTLPACHEPEMPNGEGSSLGEEDAFVRS